MENALLYLLVDSDAAPRGVYSTLDAASIALSAIGDSGEINRFRLDDPPTGTVPLDLPSNP